MKIRLQTIDLRETLQKTADKYRREKITTNDLG